jgi:hypothetical protein
MKNKETVDKANVEKKRGQKKKERKEKEKKRKRGRDDWSRHMRASTAQHLTVKDAWVAHTPAR